MRHEDIPEINNPKIRFPVLEGDKLMKEVLNGGYNVHPVPPPNSELNRESLNFQHSLCLDNVTQRSNRQAQEILSNTRLANPFLSPRLAGEGENKHISGSYFSCQH